MENERMTRKQMQRAWEYSTKDHLEKEKKIHLRTKINV